MGRRRVSLLVLPLALIGLAGCSRPKTKTAGLEFGSADPASGLDYAHLSSRIWQLTDAPSKPAPGSIYIFLANGTLLETSCVETYRIAAWTIEKKAPSVLRVVEDKQLAFTAEIMEMTNATMRWRQTLTRTNENRNLTLKAVEREFVCPDLRK